MAEIEYIRVESDLLGIWDEECSSKFFLSYQHMPFALDT